MPESIHAGIIDDSSKNLTDGSVYAVDTSLLGAVEGKIVVEELQVCKIDRNSPFYIEENNFICDKEFNLTAFKMALENEHRVEISNISHYLNEG